MRLLHVDRKRSILLKDRLDVSDILAFVDMEEEAQAEALQRLSPTISDCEAICQQYPFILKIEVVQVSQRADVDDGEGSCRESRTTNIVIAVKRTENED